MYILNEGETIMLLKIIENAKEPLETKEVEILAKKITRTKILYRLNNLRAEGLIRGKHVGSGKGTWIWWKSPKESS
jgi:repressor of nif and glnA expression